MRHDAHRPSTGSVGPRPWTVDGRPGALLFRCRDDGGIVRIAGAALTSASQLRPRRQGNEWKMRLGCSRARKPARPRPREKPRPGAKVLDPLPRKGSQLCPLADVSVIPMGWRRKVLPYWSQWVVQQSSDVPVPLALFRTQVSAIANLAGAASYVRHCR